MKKNLYSLLFLLTFLSSWSPLDASEIYARSQLLMGDVLVTLTVDTSSRNKMKAYAAMEQAFETAKKIENEVSEWRPESQTTLLNKNAGKAMVPIGRNLLNLLVLANQTAEQTGGAFDITFHSPDKKASYKDVVLFPELSLAYLPKGVTIAVSGIAKGYIVDAMSAILKKSGFRRFLVNAGDLYADGKWKIEIRDPDDRSQSLCPLSVNDQAVSTSGNYERGRHLIDPKTRQPADDFKSVTVIAKKSVTADVWAKAIFISGEYWKSKLKTPDIEIITIDRQGILKIFGNVSGRVSGRVSGDCRRSI
jgi:thiamine biosynthesis lipoprotein